MSRQMVESALFRARRKLTEEYDELASGRRCQQVQSAIEDGGALSLRRSVFASAARCAPPRPLPALPRQGASGRGRRVAVRAAQARGEDRGPAADPALALAMARGVRAPARGRRTGSHHVASRPSRGCRGPGRCHRASARRPSLPPRSPSPASGGGSGGLPTVPLTPGGRPRARPKAGCSATARPPRCRRPAGPLRARARQPGRRRRVRQRSQAFTASAMTGERPPPATAR